jgi:DNA gyrase subunit A
MGRNTGGVKAIELEDSDQVVGLAYTEPERNQVLAICERGFGKRTDLEEFRSQNRGGKGIILIDASERNGPVVGISMVKPEDEVVLITDRGQTIRTRVDEIRLTGRNAQGVRVMNVEKDERVVAMESVERDPDDLVEGDDSGSDATEDAESSGDAESSAAEGDAPGTTEAETLEDSGGSEEPGDED